MQTHGDPKYTLSIEHQGEAISLAQAVRLVAAGADPNSFTGVLRKASVGPSDLVSGDFSPSEQGERL